VTAGRAGAAGPAETEETYPERIVASRVVDTLLREGYAGLSGRVRCHDGRAVLDLPGGRGGRERALPLERDGFLADFRLLRTAAGLPAAALTLDDVDVAIEAVSDPRDREGVAAFAGECRLALAALRLRERHRPAALGRLAKAWQAAPDTRSGWRGLPGYEAIAAGLPHPAYPTSESRLGFSDEDALRYAPEYCPEFALHWVAVPRSRLTTAGVRSRPAGWPTMPEVGITGALAATHELLPVHPVTARDRLAQALAEAGLAGPGAEAERAVVAPGAALLVTPTLSTRTVALLRQPNTHLKLPLPTSTLGLLNRRSIAPETLADGALVRGIVATACHEDPLLRGGLLLADESSYAHAGHPFLGYLLRRLPSGLDRQRIVPVAALLAPSTDGVRSTGNAASGRPLVIEELARWACGGDLAGLLTAYLRLLFGVQVRLFTRYGIALESHQQNAAIALGPPAVPAGHDAAGAGAGDGAGSEAERVRLVVKDFDGALVHLPRLRAALGRGAPDEGAFADSRLVTTSDEALADVFITITVHLCAGALAFGLARSGVAPLADLLALVGRELTAALDRDAGPAASLLRARVLEADRLPGKSMVTAGTLVAKSRTGASDINKFYGTNGPNYLKDAFMRSCR
jgi:siderophore synthetase component